MFKNDINTIKTSHSILSANSIGLWRNTDIFTRIKSNYMPNFFCNTASFTNFEKNIFSNDPKITYHLSGYGMLRNESLIRFLGESAERYSFAAIYRVLKNRLIKGSYRELKNKYKESNVLDVKYINMYEGINVKSDTNITWVKMNSFNQSYKYVFIPASLVIMGWAMIENETSLNPIQAVSTGCACHQSFDKAIINSIIEYIQLDSANMWWQCGIKGKTVDSKIINTIVKNMGVGIDFLDNFEIRIIDVSFDKPIGIYICEIYSKNSNLPRYVVGMQGGLSVNETIYRSIMEALTILEYAYNYKFIDQKGYERITEQYEKFYDLDKNVIYYSKYGKPKLKKLDVDFSKNIVRDEKELISYVSNEYKYAGFLDISIDDFKSLNFSVCRVIIPELLPLYLPSLIPKQHVRFEKYEVLNDDPHPMP